jgi:hypothetical protein
MSLSGSGPLGLTSNAAEQPGDDVAERIVRQFYTPRRDGWSGERDQA